MPTNNLALQTAASQNLKLQFAVLSISGNESNGVGRKDLENMDSCVFKNLEDFRANLFKIGVYSQLKNELTPEYINVDFYDLTEFTQLLNDEEIDIKDSWVVSFYIKQ